MADVLTKKQRSYCMSQIRSQNTKPELLLKKALRGMRLRYQPKMLGRPDFASKKLKLAIFVDGCFWHRCPICSLKKPVSNEEFWSKKINSNKKRDNGTTRKLKLAGWRVIRIWEHQIKPHYAIKTARKLTPLFLRRCCVQK